MGFRNRCLSFYRRISRFSQRIASYHVSLYAANASGYMILSIFPAVILVLSLLPYTVFSETDLLTALEGVIPSILEPLLDYVIRDLSASSTFTLASVSALVAIWSSSRGVYCIQVGLNAICGVRESRSYLHMRLLSMVYTAFLVGALLLTLAIHMFGQQLIQFFLSKPLPVLQFLAKILQFRGLILLLILSTLFIAIFCVFPNRRIPPRRTFPGAVGAALGWLIFTELFSYYVKNFGSYSAFYGSLSTAAIAMLWLYICISILFYGCVFNQLIDRRRI